MENELDQIRIEGVQLNIDHDRRRFVNADNTDNFIAFPDNFQSAQNCTLQVEIHKGNIFLVDPEDTRPYTNTYKVVLPASLMDRNTLTDEAFMRRTNWLAREKHMGFLFIPFEHIEGRNRIEAQMKVYLDGNPFRIDPDARLLINPQFPQKAYSFDLFTLNQGSYTALFHKLYHSIVRGTQHSKDDPTYTSIILPQEAFHKAYPRDPEFAQNFNDRAYETGLRCQIETEAMKNRFAGELPELVVPGTSFLVNGKTKMFIEKGNPGNTYQNKWMGMGTPHSVLFDLVSKKLLTYQETLAAKVENVVVLKFGSWNELDPVGSSEHQKMGRYALLTRYPIRAKIEAVATPIAESNVLFLLQNFLPSDKKQVQQGLKSPSKAKRKKLKP